MHPMQRKRLRGDGSESKEQYKYNKGKRVPRRPQGSVSSEGAELPSQFRPNNEAD